MANKRWSSPVFGGGGQQVSSSELAGRLGCRLGQHFRTRMESTLETAKNKNNIKEHNRARYNLFPEGLASCSFRESLESLPATAIEHEAKCDNHRTNEHEYTSCKTR